MTLAKILLAPFALIFGLIPRRFVIPEWFEQAERKRLEQAIEREREAREVEQVLCIHAMLTKREREEVEERERAEREARAIADLEWDLKRIRRERERKARTASTRADLRLTYSS